MKKLFLLTLAVLGLFTASFAQNQQDNDPLAVTGRTQRTENLLTSLKKLSAQNKFMFGHHDDVVYGIGWVGDPARSDVKSVCGDYPALLGFDLGCLESGNSKNLDGVDFDRIRQEIINQYKAKIK